MILFKKGKSFIPCPIQSPFFFETTSRPPLWHKPGSEPARNTVLFTFGKKFQQSFPRSEVHGIIVAPFYRYPVFFYTSKLVLYVAVRICCYILRHRVNTYGIITSFRQPF